MHEKKIEKKEKIPERFCAPDLLPPSPELKTEALTCVSMMRRFDLRDSGPPTLLWQGSDNGLK